jgi:gamma-glutamylcyclotransferase (GGCT)/AIG2-like uncharacterized protein YtfP
VRVLIKNTDLAGKPLEGEGEVFTGKTSLEIVRAMKGAALFSEQLASYVEPTLQSVTAGDWGRVYGELLTFDDPESRLPAIDRLEGFRPGDRSLYRRVLLPVIIIDMIQPAWLYIGFILDNMTSRYIM